ncbi:FAD-dependent oxidoreductase [Paenibacillus thalictri]|nr:FAD-dependent oxidoreductase [Paenibacillus thalictri]
MRTGQYDVAVVGGGIGAVFHACSLAERGHKVVIVAEGGSLMQELGLCRLPFPAAAELAARHPVVRTWLELLKRHGGAQGDFLDPVWVQLLADRWVRERGIDVIFEVVPVRLLTEAEMAEKSAGVIEGTDNMDVAESRQAGTRRAAVQIATREGLWEVPCKIAVDCTESAVLAKSLFGSTSVLKESGHTFWALTTLNGDRLEQPLISRCGYDEAVCDIRIAPSCWENEFSITVAVSAADKELRGEIAFLGALEQVFLETKRQTGFECGDLVHVSELSWSTPDFVLNASGEDARQKDGAAAWVATPDGRTVAIGCWTAAAEAAIREASLWDQGGVAVRLLAEAGLEAADYVHNQLIGPGCAASGERIPERAGG